MRVAVAAASASQHCLCPRTSSASVLSALGRGGVRVRGRVRARGRVRVRVRVRVGGLAVPRDEQCEALSWLRRRGAGRGHYAVEQLAW